MTGHIAGPLSAAGDEIMKYMGGHLRSELPKGAVVNVTRAARADGVYRGEIIFTSTDGRVYRKKDSGSTLSTFFPDSWTPDQTIGEIVSAYKRLYEPVWNFKDLDWVSHLSPGPLGSF